MSERNLSSLGIAAVSALLIAPAPAIAAQVTESPAKVPVQVEVEPPSLGLGGVVSMTRTDGGGPDGPEVHEAVWNGSPLGWQAPPGSLWRIELVA